jgi:RND family efflux transporter MFP subunit
MTRTQFLASFAALTVSTLAAAACGRETAAAPPPPRPVLYVKVTPHTTQTVAAFAGIIEPRYQTALGFRVGGRIVSRHVDVGDVVRQGQLIAVLDDADQQNGVRAAQADVASATAQVTNATAIEGRQRTLLGQGGTSAAEHEVSQRNRETTLARLDQAKASLQRARDQVAYTRLYADFTGVVAARQAEVGYVVAAGQSIVTLARQDAREAVVDIPSALVEALASRALFDVTLQADPSVRTAGRVREIAPESDVMTRTRRVRLSLEHPPAAFRLGTTIAIALTHEIAPQIDLPSTALLEQDGHTRVWLVDTKTKTVTPRDVRVLARHEGWITVAADLPTSAGGAQEALVVTAGVRSLTAGQAVKLDEFGADASARARAGEPEVVR